MSRSSKHFCNPKDIRHLDYKQDLGDPGSFPYTRGIHPSMYRGRLWTMRQYSGFGSAEATNKRFKFLLQQGQTGLSTAFDLPTQIGFDSDHPSAQGEVGRVGVPISTLRDMELLLRDIPLDKISLSMTINSTAIVLLGFLVTLARKRKIPLRKISGTLQNDILKEYCARGTFIYPPRPSLRLCGDIIEYCTQSVPRMNPISVSGYHIREAGASAVQEIAFTMANAIAYVDVMRQRKIHFDTYGSSISFFFNAHNNFFEEIAKFRAARKIWSKLAKGRFGSRDPNAMKLRFHTQTAGSTLTTQQPLNNLARVTHQALAAILGGTQSLHTDAWDEAIGLPSEESVKTALRVQQIIAHETGIPNIADPLGGSYLIESLTLKMEAEAFALIEKIDRGGGVLAAIESHAIQDAIETGAYDSRKAMEANQNPVVGVNIFQDKRERPLKLGRREDVQKKRRIKQLQATRKSRNNRLVTRSLSKLSDAAAGTVNLVEPVLKAIECGATLGEISEALQNVFGKHE